MMDTAASPAAPSRSSAMMTDSSCARVREACQAPGCGERLS